MALFKSLKKAAASAIYDASGKSKERYAEKKEDKTREKEVRRLEREASFETRKVEAVKYAQESQKAKYAAKLKSTQARYSSSSGGGFANILGAMAGTPTHAKGISHTRSQPKLRRFAGESKKDFAKRRKFARKRAPPRQNRGARPAPPVQRQYGIPEGFI